MSLRIRIPVALLAAAVVVSFAPLPAHASVTSRGVTIPDFYTPPATLPSANGSLIRSEPLPLALSLPGIGSTPPGTATRIMYKSTDSNGSPVAVTGAYIEPAASWRGLGARPLVVLAPGTMGQSDQCSTSLALQRGLILGSEGNQTTVSIGYEILAMYRLLAKGIAVVETDYVGLGATDRLHTYVNRGGAGGVVLGATARLHTYVNGVDEGHAVLDAARAAQAMPGPSITARPVVGLYGYS